MAHCQFGKAEFWDERYMHRKEPFDWYQRWSGIKDVVTQYVKPGNRILNVGCGNSKLPEEMHEDGYTLITNIDISSFAIEDMHHRYAHMFADMQFMRMNALKMTFEDASFDAIIDKGTLDSILCGDRSSIMAHRMLSQVYRVLTAGGVYIVISYGPPENRLKYFNKPQFKWEVFCYKIAKPVLSNTFTLAMDQPDDPGVHYIYVCQRANPRAIKNVTPSPIPSAKDELDADEASQSGEEYEEEGSEDYEEGEEDMDI
jgi:EEF1A lysine methyltransferase 4